jgi:hypothetical protein
MTLRTARPHPPVRHQVPALALAAAVLVASPLPARAGLPAAPVEIWRWSGQERAPERPWPTNVIAVPLTDDDGDGDVDRDDGPDVVFLHHLDSQRLEQALTAVEGRTGEVLFTVDSPPFGSAHYENSAGALAAGDVDGDGLVELLVTYREESFPEWVPARLLAFEHDGTFAWARDWPATVDNSGQALGLADLDQDGVVEAHLLANVLSVDGSWSWAEPSLPGTREWAAFSLVADVDPESPGLELLYGANLFSATGARLWGDFFSPMGTAGIGDLDGDGDAEIAVIMDGFLHLRDHRGNVIQPPIFWGSGSPWGPRPSAPAVVDTDGDGLDEIVFSGNSELVAYGWNGAAVVEEWSVPIHDFSGICGPTAFDFDADGAAEVVHRDESFWYVFDGADGTELHREWFPSRTGSESPVVVDLGEGCGATILVTGFGDIESNDADAVDAVIAYQVPGAATPRRIWNQRTYHVTNVDEDGRIPRVEPPPWASGRGWQAQAGEPGLASGIAFDATWVDDPSDCNLGLVVSWDPAVPDDPTIAVVYDVFRSDALPAPDCADALSRPPLALGVPGPSWTDAGTEAGRSYVYAVRARAETASACVTPAEACTNPVAEEADPYPEGVFAMLRVRHVGHDVTVSWDAARALLPTEHFHLLKATERPTNLFALANPELDVRRRHDENDRGSRLQFFDLRVATACEVQSLDEYPPGW